MFNAPFSFEGRIRRTEYGLSYLTFGFTAYLLDTIFEDYGESIQGVQLLFFIPMLWFLWAQAAKRCHDIGHSGWWQLIPFYIFWLIFAEGRRGRNQYGPDPKDNDEEEGATSYVKPEVATNINQNDSDKNE